MLPVSCVQDGGRICSGVAEKMPERVQAIAWKTQKRLCGRYQHLPGQGQGQVCMAIARELTGFIWAIACEVMERPVKTQG